MEELKLTRSHAKGKHTRLANKIKDMISRKDAPPIGVISKEMRRLEELLKEVESINMRIMSSLTDETELANAEKYFISVEDDHLSLREMFECYSETSAATAGDHMKLDQSTRALASCRLEMEEQKAALQSSHDAAVPDYRLDELTNQLKNTMGKFRSIRSSILTLDSDSKVASPDSILSDCELLLNRVSILKNSRAAKHTSDDRKSSETIGKISVQLDKLPAPVFDGKLRSYAGFKGKFVNMVQDRVSEVDAKIFLEMSVPDSCKNAVNISETLADAWDALDERFGDPVQVAATTLAEIRKCPPISDDRSSELIRFIENLQDARIQLRRIDMESELAHSSTVTVIEERLPVEIVKRWRRKVLKHKYKSSELFSKLMEFLGEVAKFERSLQHLPQRAHVDKQPVSSVSSLTENVHVPVGVDNGQSGDGAGTKFSQWLGKMDRHKKCPVHNSNKHTLHQCVVFHRYGPEKKKTLVNKLSLCQKCLSNEHLLSTCPAESTSPLLQGVSFMTNHIGDDFSTRSIRPVVEGYVKSRGDHSNLDSFSPLTILLDYGSTISLILESVARLAGFKVVSQRPAKLALEVVGGSVQIVEVNQYAVPLYDCQGTRVGTVCAYGVPNLSSELPPVPMDDVAKLFSVPVEEISRPCGEIHLLIGADYPEFHPVCEKVSGKIRLDHSVFGRVAWGHHPSFPARMANDCVTARVAGVHSVTILADFFSTENMGVECTPRCGGCKCGSCAPGSGHLSLREEHELQLIQDRVVLDPVAKRVTASYPWIRDPCELPNNFPMAYKRLLSLESKLEASPHTKAHFSVAFRDMIDRGVIRILSQEEIVEHQSPVWYLPYKGVEKPSSTSTPLRIVFDPTARYRGHALNDYWAKGPNVVTNALGLLIRFCEESVAVCGDISKFYNTVWTTPVEHHCHRILYRDDPSQPISTYVIQRNSFGDGPAGVIATVALHKCAAHLQDEYPAAAKTVRNQAYVDDILDSVVSRSEAIRRTRDVDAVLDVGGFQVKQWTVSGGSSDDHSSAVSRVDIQPAPSSYAPTTNGTSVLGLQWDPQSDHFRYNAKVNFGPRKSGLRIGADLTVENFHTSFPVRLSRRDIVSQINGFYDPFGHCQAFLIKLKVELASLWRSESGDAVGWDDPISIEKYNTWKELFYQMLQFQGFTVPRCLKPRDVEGEPWLVLMSDSSMKAFGCVAYVRWRLSDGHFACRIIASKSKAWPVKVRDRLTLVRGELQGAVLAKRLAKFIQQQSRYSFARIIFLVDSEIVRAMIATSHSLPVFEANRVGAIREFSSPSQWYWIPGHLNVADSVTRGLSLENMGPDSEWQRGPDFLYHKFADWPVSQSISSSKKEELVSMCTAHSVSPPEVSGSVDDSDSDESLGSSQELRGDQIPATPAAACSASTQPPVNVFGVDISRFNSRTKLLSVTSRFVDFKQALGIRSQSGLTGVWTPFSTSYVPSPGTWQQAHLHWVKAAQVGLSPSALKNLRPFKDDSGVYRVGGRINKENDYHPVILPYDHRYSYLLMKMYHERGHLGVESTVAKSRRDYWIIKATNLAAPIRRHCVVCRFLDADAVKVRMSTLPPSRTECSRPWSNTALDMFGPFMVKPPGRGLRGRPYASTGKVWGLLLNCLSTRAVHMEVCEAYDTDNFLGAFTNFMNIRGQPDTVLADNGTQIQAADGTLTAMHKAITRSKVQSRLTPLGIEFKFIPPGSPHQNGCSEALIKSVKRSLRCLTCSDSPRLSVLQLQRVLYSIANLLNDRPIGKHPRQSDDGPYLCPNDLLLGRASKSAYCGPWPELGGKYGRYSKQLVFCERLVNEWHSRWMRLYFHTLVPQKQWHVDSRQVCVGDLVLVRDLNLVRGQWKRGEVIKILPCSDGRVRTVMIRYKVLDNREPLDAYRGVKFSTETRDVKNLVVIVPVEDL